MEFCTNKIDVHAHATYWEDMPRTPWHYLLTADELLEFYNRLGVEKGLLLPLCSPEEQCVLETTETVRLTAQKHPDRFFWSMNLDPRMISQKELPDFSGVIEYYKALGAKSVGELTANLSIDDPRYQNLLAQCQEHDMPITIHMSPRENFRYGMVDDVGLPRLEKLLKTFPKLKVLGHSQSFWAHMSTNVDADTMYGYPKGKVEPGRLVRLMEKYDNLYCDLSAGSGYNALSRDDDHAEQFIKDFGNRILFALDICLPTNDPKLPAWLDRMYAEGRISKENYWNICRNNAIRVLKLDV